MRTSSYTIYVDLPDSRSEMLLVHGYTGAYDKVSRRVAQYLRSREARRPPKPLYGEWSPEPEAPEDFGTPPNEVIELLTQRGYLTHLDPQAEEELFSRLAQKLHQRAMNRMPSYLFMPTYNCNLRCAYCFQDHMRTDGSFKHLLRTMQPKMVERIFATLPKIEALHGIEEGQAPARNIGLFGGEPLLRFHRSTVEHIMRCARDLGAANFWAVTNGTELDAYEDLLGPEGLARLQITLDGPARQHDQRRIYADGSGSFARIARHITMAMERGVRIAIRLNLDRQNLEDLPELGEEMLAQGWPKHPLFSVYTAPINAVNDKTDKGTTMNSWELDQALAALHEKHPELVFIERPDEAIRQRAQQIFAGDDTLVPRLKPTFCGAHDQMYIFDPFGDVYACWEKTGDARIRIAHITEEEEIEYKYEVHSTWRGRSVASNPACRKCRFAFHCGGGCAVLALGQRGKFHANFCDGFASRFRASIASAFLAHQAGAEIRAGHEPLCDL